MHKLLDASLGPHLMPPSPGHRSTESQGTKPLLGCVVSWLGWEGLQEAPKTPQSQLLWPQDSESSLVRVSRPRTC